MCGIIGYVGEEKAPDILLDGLRRLEYRGYDSAGVALFDGRELKIIKTKGKVEALEKKRRNFSLDHAHCGIGHTRWATHGEPDDINAHPHRVGKVTLVHNGIIENYRELKERFCPHPVSDTDSEIAAAVIDAHYHGDAVQAAFAAAKLLDGAFALGILFEDQPERIYALRKGSPLIVAVREDGAFLASDVPAILPYARDYYLPEEGELAVLSKAGVSFINQNGDTVQKKPRHADWNEEAARKDGFDHFMLKEIFEQPEVIRRTLHRYKKGNALFADEPFDFKVTGQIHVVACGSAYHAGLMGKYAIENLARIPTRVHIASEFRYDRPILHQGDLVIAVSQSGETADTIAAVRLAQEQGIRTLGLVNVQGSSLARLCDHTLFTLAGPEIAVATTKAYLCQVCLFQLIALALADQEHGNIMEAMEALPTQLEQALSFRGEAEKLAAQYKDAEHIFFMGRGQDYFLAMEGSLKLKEISYIHSESYAAGELKHGTISLITDNTPVIALMTDRQRLPKTASNLKETGARGAFVTVLTYGDVDTRDYAHRQISLPPMAQLTAPLVAAVKLQLLAYYVAQARGCDVDRPRNLAKSVTVE